MFGLSDLVYPVFTATGVRVNGLMGWTPEELKADRSGLGLRQYFGRTQIFQGTAPIGAEVELLLNGRTMDVQKVYPPRPIPLQAWESTVSKHRVAQRHSQRDHADHQEANGNEIRMEKSVVGTPQLVPQGHAAYLGIVGTKRETRVVG